MSTTVDYQAIRSEEARIIQDAQEVQKCYSALDQQAAPVMITVSVSECH